LPLRVCDPENLDRSRNGRVVIGRRDRAELLRSLADQEHNPFFSLFAQKLGFRFNFRLAMVNAARELLAPSRLVHGPPFKR
jgi:hypothetical protein